MPYLRAVRKSKWYKHAGTQWLQPNDIQADALVDLHTENNQLSVWYVDSNAANIQRIVTALAAQRQYIANCDYVLIEEADIVDCGIRAEREPGLTPDEAANGWHLELVELTLQKLVSLARAIHDKGHTTRVSEKAIMKLLALALARGQLDRNRVGLSADQLAKIDSEVARLGS